MRRMLATLILAIPAILPAILSMPSPSAGAAAPDLSSETARKLCARVIKVWEMDGLENFDQITERVMADKAHVAVQLLEEQVFFTRDDRPAMFRNIAEDCDAVAAKRELARGVLHVFGRIPRLDHVPDRVFFALHEGEIAHDVGEISVRHAAGRRIILAELRKRGNNAPPQPRRPHRDRGGAGAGGAAGLGRDGLQAAEGDAVGIHRRRGIDPSARLSRKRGPASVRRPAAFSRGSAFR